MSKGDAARTDIARNRAVSKKVTQHGHTLGRKKKYLAVSKNVEEEEEVEEVLD